MAELVLHPNKPDLIHFPCPGCGRECLLEPKFHAEGAARGVRHGHGLQHSIPVCRTYRMLTPVDFMKLATAEVPVLRDDAHVSVKLPEPPPLIMSDGARAAIRARTPAELDELERERHEREVRAFHAEAKELAHVRDKLQAMDQPPTIPPPQQARRRRSLVLGIFFGLLAVALLVRVVLQTLRAH